jgi:hypothetical protein
MERANAQEELAMIRKIMQDSQQSILADGKPFIAWGVAFAIATGVTYYAAMKELSMGPWVWFAAMAIAGIYTVYVVMSRRNSPETFASKIIGTIWGACGSAIGIVASVIAASHAITGEGLMAIISIILGIAYLVSGVVYGLPWFRNLAFGWWAGGIAIAFLNSYHILGIYLFMLVAFEIVPGIVLYRKAKDQHGRTSTGVLLT